MTKFSSISWLKISLFQLILLPEKLRWLSVDFCPRKCLDIFLVVKNSFIAHKARWFSIDFCHRKGISAAEFEVIYSRYLAKYLSRFLAHKLRWFSVHFWHRKWADFQRISNPENVPIFKEYLALKTSWFRRISIV